MCGHKRFRLVSAGEVLGTSNTLPGGLDRFPFRQQNVTFTFGFGPVPAAGVKCMVPPTDGKLGETIPVVLGCEVMALFGVLRELPMCERKWRLEYFVNLDSFRFHRCHHQ